jgi:integrase
MEKNFTKRWIESLPTPTNGRALYHDKQVRGLVCSVQPSGERQLAWYRKVRRYPRWRTLGRFPDMSVEQARGAASEANAKLAAGLDPFVDDTLTFGAAYKRYIVEHLGSNAKKPARAMAGARSHEAHFSALSGLPLNQLQRSDVTKLHSSLKERLGLYTANRALQAVKASVNWAIREKLFAGPNPAANIGIFGETKRERFLEPNELPLLFEELNSPDTSDDLRDFVGLALFCGARRNDTCSMRWADIHMSATGERFWTVPNPKSKKSKKPYNVALVEPAWQILKERQQRNNGASEWVFPSRADSKKHIVDLKKSWTTLRKRAKIPDVRLHDLRRTLGSWQAARGTSLLVIGKSLGHSSTSSTEIYSRLNLDPVRASVDGAVQAMLTAGKKRR